MAKYMRRNELVEESLCFKTFGKRLCDCSEEEKKEYFRIRKQESRKKEEIRERERQYRKSMWLKIKDRKETKHKDGLKEWKRFQKTS